VDYSNFAAVGRLLAVASMCVTVINNFWRHGDIDLTGRFANMRKIYGRAAIIGVVLAAVTRINVVAMLRTAPAFDSYLNVYGVDILDVHAEGDGGAAERRGPPDAHVRPFVGEHQHRVADLDFRVAHLAVRRSNPHSLAAADHLTVEVMAAAAPSTHRYGQRRG